MLLCSGLPGVRACVRAGVRAGVKEASVVFRARYTGDTQASHLRRFMLKTLSDSDARSSSRSIDRLTSPVISAFAPQKFR